MVSELFRRTFGRPPAVVTSSPGRVNLLGDHTDYNGGEVLPIGIAQRTHVAVGPLNGCVDSRVVSASQPTQGSFNARAPQRAGAWWDYVSGIVVAMLELGIAVPPMAIAIESEIPVGAGLSSSAALQVACGLAFTTLAAADQPLRDIALLAHRVENQFVGVNAGVMDQFACALASDGEALHLRCDTLATEHVPMVEHVLIFDTGIARLLRASAFNTRRAECQEALGLLRRLYPGLGALAHATPA